MNNLTVKQKIILGGIIGIMIIVIAAYGYIALKSEEGEKVDIENNQIENSSEEKQSEITEENENENLSELNRNNPELSEKEKRSK